MPTQEKQFRTIARSRCIFCDSEGEVLYRDMIDGLFGAPGTWSIRRCPKKSCGILWLDPAPVEADLHIAYETYFTHVPEGASAFIPRLRALLYSYYKALNSGLASIVGLRKSQEQIRMMFLGDIKRGKVLDVGCGDGGFLNLMSKAGWSVDGLDFDAKAIESAKIQYGLQLRHGDLHGAKYPDNTFDAVTMSHVIEHVPDPVSLLAEAKRVLKPGGRLVVTTPNNRSFGHEKLQRYWVGLDVPRHLNIFTLSTLRECAKCAGFEQIEATSTAANADIVFGGSYSIRHFHKHHNRPQINLLRSIKCAFLQHREFSLLKENPESGEEAVLICIKNELEATSPR